VQRRRQRHHARRPAARWRPVRNVEARRAAFVVVINYISIENVLRFIVVLICVVVVVGV
jgi:hypothetical protein